MSYFALPDPARSCWNCYWCKGERVARIHTYCYDNWPSRQVIARPERGCAFFVLPPAPGEPKPLTSGERAKLPPKPRA